MFSFLLRSLLARFLIRCLILLFIQTHRRKYPFRSIKTILSSGPCVNWRPQRTWWLLDFRYRFRRLARSFLTRCSFCYNPTCPRKSLSLCTLLQWTQAASGEAGLPNVWFGWFGVGKFDLFSFVVFGFVRIGAVGLVAGVLSMIEFGCIFIVWRLWKQWVSFCVFVSPSKNWANWRGRWQGSLAFW